MEAASARRHLARIAQSPRPAGSESEAAARRYCSEVLGRLGFAVTEEAFEYSSAPGRWATPLAGALSMAGIAAVGHVGNRDDPVASVGIMLAVALVGIPAAMWTARRGVLSLPVARRTGVNLVATRRGPAPLVWLVAHLDSKSQPIPTAVRALGIALSVLVWVVAFVTAVMQWRGADLAAWWVPITLAGWIAALPVIASFVGERSPGALDNASGVATVLGAAEAMDGAPVGVLLTSAEELGLAGARAWASTRQRGVALNCDGVDDRGGLVCMRSGRGRRAVMALQAGAARSGVALQVRRLIPGLLVDAVALADAGWDTATLSRGTWGTLARIHRPGDDLHRMTGTGIDEAARVMAAAASSAAADSVGDTAFASKGEAESQWS